MSESRPASGFAGTLLDRLPELDRQALRPALEQVSVTVGTTLFDVGSVLEWAYFPQGGIISLDETCDASVGIEAGLIGSEGMAGWAPLLGCDRAANRATVRMVGQSLIRVPIGALLAACRAREVLRMTLLRYVHVMTIQMSRAMVSHLHDPVIRRVSRWLLMRHDRVAGNDVEIRHEEIAACLDVRRASVTDALHVLEGERLIRCFRGQVLIRDRAGLEGHAGQAYGHAEAAYCALIGSFGKGSIPLDVPAIMPAARDESCGARTPEEQRLFFG